MRAGRPLLLSALVALAAACTCAWSAGAALAAPGAVFALKPAEYRPAVPATKGYFILDGKPGQTIDTSVEVVNAGSAPGTVLLYPVDATTGQTSGTVYLSRHDPRRGVGAWLRLPVSRLTLAPGERRIVPFSLTVPRTAWLGQHVGGIVAENATLQTGPAVRTGKQTGGFQIRIRNLAIVGVEVNLPGPAVERLQLDGVRAAGSHGYQTVLLGLRNSGNRLLKPTGTITVSDSGGRVVQRHALALDSVLPQSRIDYPVLVRGRALAPGSYLADVELRYGHGRSVHARIPFRISSQQVSQVFAGAKPVAAPRGSGGGVRDTLPWLLAGLAALAALALALVLLRSRQTAPSRR